MFIGHYAVALGVKRLVPSVSLGALFVACQLADLIWPNLVLLGIERVEIDPGNTAITPLNFVYYPYSHSLLGMFLSGAVLAILYSTVSQSTGKAAGVITALVVSHWVLDALTHRPDMPVVPGGSAHIGFGLWNLPALAVSFELLLFASGAWLYAKSTKPMNRRGSVGFRIMIGFLLLVYTANVVANLGGAPPPSVDAVAWSAQAMWLIVIWGYWIDRHRVPIGGQAN